MPTYEYRCKACGHDLEVVQAFTDDALTTCPDCGAEQLRKVFGAVGISFKGSGFYKTDSRGSGGGRSKESTTESTSESTKESTGGSSGDSSGDSKSSNGSSSSKDTTGSKDTTSSKDTAGSKDTASSSGSSSTGTSAA